MVDPILPPAAQYLRDDVIRGGMDLLLFAHKSHLRRVDDELSKLGLGRAHHRCLYFIARQPGLSIAQLLMLLGVTKQSLGRVMHVLRERGLVEQRAGDADRRQRLLHLTDEGTLLEKDLFDELHSNMSRAYTAAGEEAVRGFWAFMQNLMCDDARRQFASLQGTSRRAQPVGSAVSPINGKIKSPARRVGAK